MVQQAEVRETSRIVIGDAVVTPDAVVRHGLVRRVSWAAVFAGTAAALTTQVLFTALGAGIGLAVAGPGTDAESIAIGAGVWWLITGWIALFFGGAIAGRLAGILNGCEACIHGMLVWALAGVIGVALLTTGSAAMIGGAMGPMARGYGGWNTDTPAVSGLGAVGRQAIEETGRLGQARTTSGDATEMRAGTPTETGMRAETQSATPERASAGVTVDQVATTEQARKALASAGIWSFFALLIGMGVASLGGYVGRPETAIVSAA